MKNSNEKEFLYHKSSQELDTHPLSPTIKSTLAPKQNQTKAFPNTY